MAQLKPASLIIGRLTNLFQRHGEVEPNALIRALEREVVKQKTKDNRVPNSYTIYLREEDCYRLSAARLIKTLSVKIKKMTQADGDIVIVSAYVEDTEPEDDTINLENDVLSHTLIKDTNSTDDDETIVADKTQIVRTMRTAAPRRVEYNLAVITDLTTAEIVVGERQIYLGRKDTNDFVLEDESVSRIHAYVAYERHRHVLYDAGSLNGTLVNKKPISRHELRDGDKILIGNTTLTYKVL